MFDVFSECLLDGFWNGFGLVLGDFVMQNDDQKEKERFVEMVVLFNNIDVFRVCGFHLGCQKKRKTECKSDLYSNSVL